ncbi:tripartite tricarboxylate transporter substrate binding protein [uncultured Hydrogenophaga sp.]|uniref:Bug family tripartite tricarboxylate transporter substrate binding protein n=1 Tax=uncultured Hydrogenophaga sp. TaxID=199683 RepID=UPI00258A345B|nr:tripartite tricarboxylate transporter substrate binding protein [uncultured Hydrogenophaga sp.]
MTLKRRTLAAGLTAGLAMASLPIGAWAQAYPSRTIKLIAGFAAGGPADGIARSIAKALEDELKQPVVVENKAGAAGVIGLDALTNSPPDGYTIGLLANTTTNALHFQGKTLDADARFTPVGKFVSTRIVLVVNPDLVPAKTLPEFIDFLRRNPETTLTSAGHGGLGHLGLELFAQDQKLKIVHVAYRGSAPAMQDVVAGQVAGMVVDASSAMSNIQAGRLRVLATVSSMRTPSLPDVPTALELGIKSLQIDSSMGIVLPPKTPKPIVDRMRAALKAAVNSPFYTDVANKAGNAHFFDDADKFKAWLQEDFDRSGKIIRTANIKPQ